LSWCQDTPLSRYCTNLKAVKLINYFSTSPVWARPFQTQPMPRPNAIKTHHLSLDPLMCPIRTFACVKFRRDCAAAAVLALLVFLCWQGADLRLRGVDLRIAAHPLEDYAPSSPFSTDDSRQGCRSIPREEVRKERPAPPGAHRHLRSPRTAAGSFV
jgi:hypothetical protein